MAKTVNKKQESVKEVKPEKEKEIKKVSTTKVKEVKPEKKKEIKKVPATKVKEVKPVKEKSEIKKEKKEVVAKKEAVKTAAKPIVKKEASKKTVAKKKVVSEDAPKVATRKVETKKAKKVSVTKKVNAPKYDEKSLDECIYILNTMGVHYSYDDYVAILMDEENLDEIAKNIIEGNKLNEQMFDYQKDGYDLDIVKETLLKVVAVMGVSASEYKNLKKKVATAIKYKESDPLKDAKEYLDEFKLAEKLLMIAQRKNINDTKEAKALIKADVYSFFVHFFKFASHVLPTWKYEDAEYYQEFAFAILSQYNDLYEEYQNEIQMDCADLFIKHFDEARGDADYNYVLRENEIKDYIYYRFANAYLDVNLDKAKSIAHSAFQFVDDRYEYFTNLVAIIDK